MYGKQANLILLSPTQVRTHRNVAAIAHSMHAVHVVPSRRGRSGGSCRGASRRHLHRHSHVIMIHIGQLLVSD